MSMNDGVYYKIRSVVPITHFEKRGHFRNKPQRRSLLLNTISRKKVSSLTQLEMIHHFLIIFLHSFCLLVAFTTTNCTTEQLQKLIILMSLIFASFNFLFGVVQIDKLSSILLPKVIDDCLLDVIERES